MGARRLLVVLLAAGCAATTATAPPTTPEKPPITVAVIGFGGTNSQPSLVENGCVMALLEAGYRVVDRQQIVAALPDENDIDFGKVGRQLAADLIVDGGLARGSKAAAARLAPRLISTHSSNVLGTTKTKGRVKLVELVGKQLCAELIGQLP
jgi:hypothetical protein